MKPVSESNGCSLVSGNKANSLTVILFDLTGLDWLDFGRWRSKMSLCFLTWSCSQQWAASDIPGEKIHPASKDYHERTMIKNTPDMSTPNKYKLRSIYIYIHDLCILVKWAIVWGISTARAQSLRYQHGFSLRHSSTSRNLELDFGPSAQKKWQNSPNIPHLVGFTKSTGKGSCTLNFHAC